MSDTPETDAANQFLCPVAQSYVECVATSFGRRLERERDALRRTISGLVASNFRSAVHRLDASRLVTKWTAPEDTPK